MPEVIFAGPEGRLEGRYHPSDDANAPCALILSPHPKAGGHMDHRIPVAMYEQYKRRGFSVLRFNFRGIGRSKGVYCLLYTSPSPRDKRQSRMPSSA